MPNSSGRGFTSAAGAVVQEITDEGDHVAVTYDANGETTVKADDTDEHRLVIDKGILTRHHIVVPFDRVQQVDINRRFTALVLGLAAVRIWASWIVAVRLGTSISRLFVGTLLMADPYIRTRLQGS